MFIARDPSALPGPSVRAELIAARVTEIVGDVAQHLAIASDQAMPRPTFRQRVASKLKSMVLADAPAPAAFDTGGYYPVRRTSVRAD